MTTIALEPLMFRLLAEAERDFFGPRDPRYLVSIEAADIPSPMTIMPDPGRFLIRVTSGCLTNLDWATYEIAHEVGHVICGPGPALNIEEGACVVNSLDAIANNYEDILRAVGSLSLRHPARDYWRAEYLIRQLLRRSPDAIRRLRKIQPKLSLVDADTIRQCVPALPRRLAEQLATRWEPS